MWIILCGVWDGELCAVMGFGLHRAQGFTSLGFRLWHLGLVRVQNGRKRECMQHLRFKVTCGCEFEGFLI